MPQRWAIRLAIQGDLRFLSHRDLLRAMERITARANLPVTYSQGFNPRQKLSLACPRPVGVTSLDDPLIFALDEPMEADELLARLNDASPEAIRFLSAETMETRRPPRPTRNRMELAIPPDKLQTVKTNLNEISTVSAWPIERKVSVKRGRHTMRSIDIRPMVENLRLEGETLRFTLVRHGDLWARPGEVLRLLGLDDRVDLARVVRTAVECET